MSCVGRLRAMKSAWGQLGLRFRLDPDSAKALGQGETLSDPTSAPPQYSKHLETYFDTAKRDLRRVGAAVAVRRRGRHWLQTVRREVALDVGVFRAEEIESYISAAQPDIAAIQDTRLRKLLEKAVGTNPLLPVFEASTGRATHHTKTANANEARLVHEQGEVIAGDRRESVDHVELRLIKGSAAELETLATALLKGSKFDLLPSGKVEAGYQLGTIQLKRSVPAAPRRDTGDKKVAASGAEARNLATAADQILTNWSLFMTSDAPLVTHQMRVGLRRLRTALRSLQSPEGTSYRELRMDCRDLARMLGELRDLDSLQDAIIAPAISAASEDPGAAELLQLIAQRKQAVRARLRQELATDRWLAFEIRLALMPQRHLETSNQKTETKSNPRRKPAAGKSIQVAWRRLAKLGRRIDELTVEERHDMRKAIKTLRYLSEFHQLAYVDRKVTRFAQCLRRLQDDFGYLNDLAQAQGLKALCAEGTLAPDAWHAAGYIRGWHETRAGAVWERARRDWRELERAPKFWL